MTDRRAYLTAKKRESRARARAAGRCIICTTNAADPELVTCNTCRRGVTVTRRSYAAWSGVILERVREIAGDDLNLQYHQPADRMVEFVVRSNGDILRRRKTLAWYDWRKTEPSVVADDILVAHRELRTVIPRALSAV